MKQKPTLKAIRSAIRNLADADRAKHAQRYFKTGPGEYGEGDCFLGLRMPQIRALVKQFGVVSVSTIKALLKSRWHEERMLALLLMVHRYKKSDESEREELYLLYLDSTEYINNWDLVDLSARDIVGAWLYTRSRKPLYTLARSDSLWERRIAMLSTSHFIGKNDFDDALKLAKILLQDEHDLMHKAVGWMLREIGKRDRNREEEFLLKHYRKMPRTMLRYAIEHFPEKLRKAYLNGTVISIPAGRTR